MYATLSGRTTGDVNLLFFTFVIFWQADKLFFLLGILLSLAGRHIDR
jgi:hypothetical protein